jgi:class 3 adenylate cyclase/tetratricopeptide (TPR) repeat protein
MQMCPSCGEENPDRFRLCGFCGTQLAVEQPARDTRKTVTVVFCDLKGSTSLGERLDTESLREVLAHYFARMKQVLERHGGTVEKYIGDAIMAVFGLPRAHEDDALRAVRAAEEMRRMLPDVNQELQERWGVRLANRTGVNTGEVVAGDVTRGQRLVTGDTVNVAARLEQAAPECEVLIGEPTYRLVRDAVEVVPVEPLELKGKAERVPAYRLVSVGGVEAFARHLDTPMVGRHQELEIIRERFQHAVQDRRAQLVTVLGHAGAGKSRLIYEFLSETVGRAMALRGRCLPYGEGITFWPLSEVVRQVAGIAGEDSPDDARAKLESLLEPAVYARIASAVGLASQTFPLEETFWGARKFVEALARERPLVVVIDDIHWAESTLLDLIEHLLDTVHDAPVLLLCSARHELLEERSTWAVDRDNADRVVLEPLSEEESSQIVDHLLGDAPLPAQIRARIVQASEGNPLFVEQLLSMLVDDGLIAKDTHGRWVVKGELKQLAVPPTISALLSARLDRLAGEEKAVLQRGSVVGPVFYGGAVRWLSPTPLRPKVPESLASLERKQMIRPDISDVSGEDAYRFHHMLIRDAAYQGLLKRDRVELHEAVADWLEQVAANLMEFEEVTGYHLEQAYRYRVQLGAVDEAARQVGRRGAHRLSAAGRRALARGDMPAAANLLERSVALLEADDPLRLALVPDLGEALDAIGEFERAMGYLAESREAARLGGHRSVEMEIAVVGGLVQASAVAEGKANGALGEAERAIPTLEEFRNYAGLARAWRLVAFIHGTAGRYGDAEGALQRVIDNARLAGDQRQERRSVPNFAFNALYGPTPVPEAIARCEMLLAKATDDRRAEALVRGALAQLRAMRGEFEEARELCLQSRAILEDLGERVLAASRSLDSARVEMLAEDPDAAERQLRRDYEALEAIGERYYLPGVAGLLAHALNLRGNHDEALEFSRISQQWGEEDAEDQALWRRARAKVLARRGELDEAEATIREAVKLVEQTDSPVLQANTLLDLAEVLRIAGNTEDVVVHVQEARRLFEQKGNVVSAKRALTVLDELTAHGVTVPAP